MPTAWRGGSHAKKPAGALAELLIQTVRNAVQERRTDDAQQRVKELDQEGDDSKLHGPATKWDGF